MLRIYVVLVRSLTKLIPLPSRVGFGRIRFLSGLLHRSPNVMYFPFGEFERHVKVRVATDGRKTTSRCR